MTQITPPDFAASTRQWWAMAAQWLSWRPDEFWRATPGELRSALSEPNAADSAQGPSMEIITQMLERESNG